MKKILYIAATSFLLSLLAQPVRAAEDSKPVEFVIEDFDPAKQSDNEKVTGFIPGVFPYDWRYRNSKAKSIFGVLKEGDKYFVKARSFNTGIQILKKIDVDQNMDLAQKYGIQVVPTLIIEKDGKVIHQLEGVTGAETLEGYLKPLL